MSFTATQESGAVQRSNGGGGRKKPIKQSVIYTNLSSESTAFLKNLAEDFAQRLADPVDLGLGHLRVERQ